jgi:hypothetical protein
MQSGHILWGSSQDNAYKERNGYELLDIIKHFKEFLTTFSPVIKYVWELEVIFSACLNTHWYWKLQISNINYMSGFHSHLDTLQPSSIAEFANPLFKTQLDIAVPFWPRALQVQCRYGGENVNNFSVIHPAVSEYRRSKIAHSLHSADTGHGSSGFVPFILLCVVTN